MHIVKVKLEPCRQQTFKQITMFHQVNRVVYVKKRLHLKISREYCLTIKS